MIETFNISKGKLRAFHSTFRIRRYKMKLPNSITVRNYNADYEKEILEEDGNE